MQEEKKENVYEGTVGTEQGENESVQLKQWRLLQF